jgi:mannose-6-phosphate isomerase-like protein (cupin superfamily)
MPTLPNNIRRSPYVTHAADSSFTAKGRRSFARYRDLGVAKVSDGRYGAVVIDTNGQAPQATGWHYHECELQVLFVLEGWVNLDFEDGTSTHLEAGSCLTIPGRFGHNETGGSPDLKVIEVTVPGEMGTVPIDPPRGLKAQLG